MDKIKAVIKREYLTRVKNKTFILITLLVPVLLGLLMTLPVLMTFIKSGVTSVCILDESQLFTGRIEGRNSLEIAFVTGTLEEWKLDYKEKYDALLHIPNFDLQYPGGVTMFSENQVGISYIREIEDQIENVIETIRFENAGLDKDFIDKLKARIRIESIMLTGEEEKQGNVILSTILGQLMGFIMYFVIFMYGSLVMAAVMEDKKHKIVEILVSSLKPFELMLGKIIGIAAVALTQLIIWIVLIGIIIMLFTLAVVPYIHNMNASMVENAAGNSDIVTKMVDFLNAPGAINFPLLTFAVFFFFIFGYFFYCTLFAAIGSISDDEANQQVFTLPITIPIILSIIILINVVEEPHGPLAVWASIIPFSSPIIMLARIPFNVPMWQMVVSCIVLVLSFIGSTWVSGKIYRTGILLYGKKLSWKDVWRFIRS